ncbi:shikimate kinase [Halomicronema hongdechloris]|uniref:shikimate kinase n=1 Tax=Halomicronema hongdechloris TaxID=1209493 RepID=UPI00211ABA43|nr:shikimate kinase [Halomicronema hongdechloris]
MTLSSIYAVISPLLAMPAQPHPLSDLLKGTNLYLIGMMGSGKSTIGHLLGRRLNYRFIDTDELIEQTTGQTIPEIFQQHGEASFRQIETDVLAQVSAYTRLVVATGGGIVTQPYNWSYLHHGLVIWLEVPLAVLQRRLQGDTGRPLLQSDGWTERLQALLEQRQPLYAQADVRVTVTAQQSPKAVTRQTLEQIGQVLRSPTPEPPPIAP